MGNHGSCMIPYTKGTVICLIHSDGNLDILHKPVNAGEIMEKFPENLVCHSDSFYIGQKIPALSPKEQLKMGHKYFILPKQSFQSVLSFVSVASFMASPRKAFSDAVTSIPSAPRFSNLFEIEKVEGGLRIKVSAEFVSKLMEDAAGRFGVKERAGEINNSRDPDIRDQRLCNTPELQKDYAQLVTSRNGVWRPKLESIREKEKVKRFNINRRHKSF